MLINPCYYKIMIPHPSTKKWEIYYLPSYVKVNNLSEMSYQLFNIFIALRTEKEEATNCYLFYFSNWPTPKAQVWRAETQLRVLQVESLSLRYQEDLQAMKSNDIKYTTYSKSCNTNIVTTCESTIWNPPAISLEINLG